MDTTTSKPLEDKLNLKPGDCAMAVNPPDGYLDLFTTRPTHLVIRFEPGERDFIHLFAADCAALDNWLPILKTSLSQNGKLWVSWPKKSAQSHTDLTEDYVRSFGLSVGLVDTKIAAIDDYWSALKFVFRLRDRR